MLLDPLVPLPEQVEAVRVSHVVDQNDLVGFAEQVESDLLENVLACNVDQVQLDTRVGRLLGLDLFDLVLAALGHHVVMVERVTQVLVNNLGLAHGGLTRDDYARAQS